MPTDSTAAPGDNDRSKYEGTWTTWEHGDFLPPGYVPVWTFIKTEDGVVEYDHPAADLLATEAEDDD